MKFSLEQAITVLSKSPQVYQALYHAVPSNWLIQTEGPKTWSPFDILGHLIHGEKTDWMPRSRIILAGGQQPFESFDRFAQFEASRGKTIDQLLKEFQELREANMEELRSWKLTEQYLRMKGRHPELGEVTLKQLLATWTIHDLHHLNQATRVMTRLYQEEVGPWKKYLKLLNDVPT